MEIESKDITMDILFNNTLVLILSALGFVIVAGALLSILLSQRLHKRHRGYNPTDNQVRLFIDNHKKNNFYKIVKMKLIKNNLLETLSIFVYN